MKKYKKLFWLILEVTLLVNLTNCTAAPQTSQAGLSLEEHSLQGKPQLDPLTISPQEGTQEQILLTHAIQRSVVYPPQTTVMDGNPGISTSLDGKPLIAELFFTDDYLESFVTVTLEGNEIYRIATGPASPVTSLIGLWTYNGIWALETVLINTNTDQPFATGQISINGVLQNDSSGFQEAFGFQLLAGLPFFFFVRDGKIGYLLDDQETMLGYDEITHYNCCSESAMNPIQAQDMVAFFARKGDAWFYVELGKFNP
jgi:hypothetical protein